ncbi:MAG: lipid-A-disaccharide synthase [Candidatus Omnitrophica bacterium]|nr:lipid-A-disaccharide synthase [Candidatus Omnitrophota bacterium]
MPKKIMIIAGESSGDFHASSLIQALKKINPDIEICGIGAEKMRQAGAKLYFDISELSIIGFTDVLKNLKQIKHVFNNLLKEIDQKHPEAVVLVDYPGFNLKLAQEVKKRGIPVIYYISPQIWAWWRGRIKTIKRFVDKMIVIFKFEEDLYKNYGIDVSFVGHPLLDIAHPRIAREEFLSTLGVPSSAKVIGLAPGSRRMEVERILPILLETAKAIKQKLPEVQFLLLKAPSLGYNNFDSKINQYNLPIRLCENQTYDFLNACDFVLVASGTATLETAIMQKPMVIVYKVSFLNWLIARLLIRLPFIGLVNVVAQELIVPEFVQYRAKPSLIAKAALEILGNQDKLAKIKAKLEKVHKSLGTAGASTRAAQIILKLIS